MNIKFKHLLIMLSLLLSTNAFAAGEEYNIRFNPLGLLVGAVNVNFDIAMNEQWTFGPELVYWQFDTDTVSTLTSGFDITAMGIGARANWYANGVHSDGLYVGPSLNYVTVNAEYSEPGYSSSGDASGLYASALVGYGWFWESFNILLGGGFTTSLTDTEVEVRDSSGNSVTQSSRNSGLALEFSIGWTF